MANANLNIEDWINQLNILWAELLRVYAIKEKLPLAGLDIPYYYLSPDREGQQVELRNYMEQWRGKKTSENLKEFYAIQDEIRDLEEKFNAVISRLRTDEVTIISIDDFSPEDLLLFGEDTISLSQKLEEVKTQKARLLEQKKYDWACYYRGEEKAILEAVANRFAKDYPGLYFKASHYRQNDVIFMPTGSNCDMKELIERVSRKAYKNN
jgi:hypothetical protein